MIAKSLPLFSSDKTVHLPASVVPELELNGINPPPDTIEEVPIPDPNPFRTNLNRITSINSKCGDSGRANNS